MATLGVPPEMDSENQERDVEDSASGHDLNFPGFAIGNAAYAAWFSAKIAYIIYCMVVDAILVYTISEVFHAIKSNMQWWRNETFWYWMSYPYFNFTTLNLYDWWNLTYHAVTVKPVNFALGSTYWKLNSLNNIIWLIFGPEVSNVLFPEGLMMRLSNWTFEGNFIPIWYQLGLNRSWHQLWLTDMDPSNHSSSIIFDQYMTIFNKSYLASDIPYRSRVFVENLKFVDTLNRLETGSAKYGMSVFSDLTLNGEDFQIFFLSRDMTLIRFKYIEVNIDFDETFEKDELNEDDPKGEDLDVFLLAKLVELAGIIGATGWWVLVWVIKHILLYTLYEEVHILKDKLLYWRNETYEYFMSWPQINFTVAGIYDLLNLYYNWQLDVPINQNLKVLRLINRWKSNITLRAFGQEVNQFLFPPEKGGILDGLYVNGSWVQLWFNAGLNRTWGLPFIFHSQERLPFTGDTNHVSAMWSSYERFLRLFDLQYSLIEKLSRFRIFMKNLMMIIRLNAQEQGSAGYGFTHFAALSQEEFMMKYTSHIPTYTGETYYSNDDIVSSFTTTPAEFDWRSKQVVSGVKNQKYCTGSWAYAVVDCLEAHNAIRQGSLVELSTQQIIDCDKNSKGCKGGSVTNAYQYLYHAGGLAPASAYAYTGRQGNCSFKPKMAVVKVRNTFHSLPQREETMRQFIYNYGPTVATLNAAQLQFYKRGIIRCDNHLCDSTLTNHAVTIVGYGIERGYIDSYVGNNSQSGNPYWLIKNSWGPAWGEKGYFRLFRGENTLGIQNFVTAPVVVPEDT